MATATAAASPSPASADFAHFYQIIDAFRDAAPDDAAQISVPKYLDAMNKFLRIFDALGLGSVGDMVKKDVDGNILKLGKASGKYGAATLSDVLTSELSDASYAKKIRAESGAGRDSGTVALLWMKRVMQLIHALVKNLVADQAVSLADASRASYACNLRLCHPFITRGVFDAGLRFAPARETFYKNLGAGEEPQKAETALNEFLAVMTPIVDNICRMYKANDLEPYIKT